MSPSTITIRIDLGAEGAVDLGPGVSIGSGAPTPVSAAAFRPQAPGLPTGAPPAPHPATAGDGGLSAPAPSISLTPAGSALGDMLPTPFSSGGFSVASTDQAAGAVPTPFDHPDHHVGGAGDQAPAPPAMAESQADMTAVPRPEGGETKAGTAQARRRARGRGKST